MPAAVTTPPTMPALRAVEAKTVNSAPGKAPAADEEMMPGVPRDVNMEKLNKMIKSGKLSNKESEFYRKIE